MPPVPNSWQPQSARDAKSALSPTSEEQNEEGDMFPGPDFSFRHFQPLARD